MRHALSILGILLTLAFLPACGGKTRSAPPEPQQTSMVRETGSPLPAFSLKDADGNPIGFTPGTDELTVLEVWAPTWFEQAEEQFRRLEELHERFGNRGVRVLCLAYEAQPAQVRQAIEKHAALFDVALGEEPTWEMLELQSLPTTWILDREGRTIERLEGFQPLETLEKSLEEILSGPHAP